MSDTAVGATQVATNAPGLKKITFLAAAGAFLDGYDLLIINAALLLIIPEFDLTGRETGLLTSLPFLAMAIGALVAGRVCDLVGRRRVYMIDVILFFVFSILQALSQEVWQLFIMRFLIGFAIGMDMPTGGSMLAEFAPKDRLGRLTGMMQSMWVFGGLVAAAVGLLLYETAGPSAWRWMFASAALPAIIIAVLRHSLPETPRWLANRHRTRGSGLRGLKEIIRVKAYRRPVAFFATYWMVESFLGGPPFIYTAVIFSNVIELDGSKAILLSVVLASIYLVVNLTGQYVVLDRVGRKPIAVGACAVAAIAGVATGFLEHTSVALVIAFGALAVAINTAPLPFWPWSVEQLPTRIRATGQSIGSAGAKFGQFIGLNLFTASAIASIGWTTYFVSIGVGFALLAAFVVVVGKETKGTDIGALD